MNLSEAFVQVCYNALDRIRQIVKIPDGTKKIFKNDIATFDMLTTK